MKKFLFIYSLVITVGLSFFFAFSNPSKSTLIISFLMLPIPAYFFISLTNPREVSAPKWSVRILVIIFLLSLLSLISLKLLNINTNKTDIKIDQPKTETPIKSPEPTGAEKVKGSQDFTDILMEESKKTEEPKNTK